MSCILYYCVLFLYKRKETLGQPNTYMSFISDSSTELYKSVIYIYIYIYIHSFISSISIDIHSSFFHKEILEILKSCFYFFLLS